MVTGTDQRRAQILTKVLVGEITTAAERGWIRGLTWDRGIGGAPRLPTGDDRRSGVA